MMLNHTVGKRGDLAMVQQLICCDCRKGCHRFFEENLNLILIISIQQGNVNAR